MQLTTQRTELNLIQKKDYSEVITSFREKEAVKFLKHLQNLTDEEYINFLEKKRLLSQNQELFYWVVREKQNKEKETQNYIGTMGLTPYLGSDSVFHIGFLISKDFQGKALATELGQTVIDFVKNKLKHKEIYGLIIEGNIASQALLQKLGFEFVGSNFNTDYQIQLETYKLIF